jgi:hypothetical protein
MRKPIVFSGMGLFLAMAIMAVAGVGPPALNAIWADDMLYATVGTPTELPDRGPTDGLYVIEGLEGQRAVSEAKPGDQDYNGGRWQVYNLEWTASGMAAHDSDSDGEVDEGMELTNWEDVEYHMNVLGHLMQTGMGDRFVCPLIKKKH